MRHLPAFIVLSLLCGCSLLTGGGKYVPVKQYVLEPKADAPKAAPTDKTLAVRSIEAARPYREQVAYRESGMVLGHYEDCQWSERPGDVVTRTLIQALEETGRFKDVANAEKVNLPNLILTGEIERFDLDLTTAAWTACVQIRFEIRAANSGEPYWIGTVSDNEALSANQLSALPEAMSRAASKALSQAVGQIVK